MILTDELETKAMADNFEPMSDSEHEKFLDSTIIITYREYDLSLERARQSGLKIGMEVGRLNAEHAAITEKSKAVRAACKSFANYNAKLDSSFGDDKNVWR